MLLSVRTVRMQIGDHLDEPIELSRQGGTVAVQLGVRCHVLNLRPTEPIDETVFAERVTTLGKTAGI